MAFSLVEQTAQATVRLPISVFEVIKHTEKTNYLDLCLHGGPLDKYNVSTIHKILTGVYYCPLAGFSDTIYITDATSSMTAVPKHGEEAQVNTILICGFYCKTNSFKPVQHTFL